MYNLWNIKIGDRLHNPINNKTYLILSEQGDDFFCLEYKEDKTDTPRYLNVEREFFYKLFHLIDGLNAEQTISSPNFKNFNFYISKTSVIDTEDSLGLFKFYPTFQEVVQLIRKINYIQNPEIVAEELIAKGRVWIDSTFLIEIKEY